MLDITQATPCSASGTFLVHREPNSPDRNRAILVGLRKGFLFGILLGVFGAFGLIFLHLGYEERRVIFCAAIISGALIGLFTGLIYYQVECAKGFFCVDNDILAFWTPWGIRSFPLESIFGAGPEEAKGGKHLRICLLHDNYRGFRTFTRNFEYYELAYGEIRSADLTDKNGNQIARHAVINHVRERKRKELPTAHLPPFKFDATVDRVFPYTGLRLKASFTCDGKILRYETDSNYPSAGPSNQHESRVPSYLRKSRVCEIPVHLVKDFTAYRYAETGTSSTYVYTGLLALDPSSSQDTIRLPLGLFSHGEEIVRYCQCLPALLPEFSPDDLIDF